jgi:hypothetical protein
VLDNLWSPHLEDIFDLLFNIIAVRLFDQVSFDIV